MTEEELYACIEAFPHSTRVALSQARLRRQMLKFEVKLQFPPIQVYRAIKEERGPVTVTDFMTIYDIEAHSDDEILAMLRVDKSKNIHNFGISFNEDIDELKTGLHFPNARYKGIAEGALQAAFGPADFKRGKTHHNWYIFEACLPSVAAEFRVIDDAEDDEAK